MGRKTIGEASRLTRPPKIALVCSWLNQYGGAERVLEHLHALFPAAPIYTSIYDPLAMPASWRDWDIRTSFLQRIPWSRSKHRLFLALFPMAFRSLRLEGYDLVINNTSAFSHGVRLDSASTHISYCLTPARFVWRFRDYVARENIPPLVATSLVPLIAMLRHSERNAARSVNHFVAISREISHRIRDAFGRESEVIPPAIEFDRYRASDQIGDSYLVVSRLVPYKRIDLAVRAFTEMGKNLIIAGDGRDRAALEQLAGPSVRFAGRVSDEQLIRLYSECRALIFTGREDFGLTPLEAQASGRPVIAFGEGGALETVLEDRTGLFFRQPTEEALMEAVTEFERHDWDPNAARENARGFDVSVFNERIRGLVERIASEG